MNALPLDTFQPIALTQWVPVLQRSLCQRNALVAGQSQHARRLLKPDNSELTMFWAGAHLGDPATRILFWHIAEHDSRVEYFKTSLPTKTGLVPRVRHQLT